MTEPRGIRLNNPGNIRHGDKWDGRSADQPDPAFVKFDQPQFGIRALARTLITYEKKGFNSVRKVIGRWAPPVENDTGSYVLHVAELLGVDPDAEIDIDSYDVMRPLVEAIIRHENGKQPYSDKLIRDSLRLAGVVGTPKKKMTERGGFKTQVVAGAATTLAAVAPAAEPVRKAAEQLDPFSGSQYIAYLQTGLLTVAGIAAFAGIAGLWLKSRNGL